MISKSPVLISLKVNNLNLSKLKDSKQIDQIEFSNRLRKI